MMMRKAASLVDLCVQNTIDNIRYLRDVGDTADHLLERILSHFTHFQLTHIEDSTKAHLQHWLEVAKKCMDRHKEEKAKEGTMIFRESIEVPPSRTKRSYWGGVTANNIYNTKSSTRKKAKLEFFNSGEDKNIVAKKTKVVGHKNHSVPSKAKHAL